MRAIAGIVFGVYSPEQIRRMSAAKITVADTYDEDGYPIQNGLADQRLGVIDPGLRCRTCGGRMKTCPGHFGHIELVRPLVHPAFAKLVYSLLTTFCRKCGQALVPILRTKAPAEAPAETPAPRIESSESTSTTSTASTAQSSASTASTAQSSASAAQSTASTASIVQSTPASTQASAPASVSAKPGSKQTAAMQHTQTTLKSESITCPSCGEAQRKITFIKPTTFYEEERRLLPNEIRERLERISDEDIKALGLSMRPEWAILTVLPVPPVTVRPTITLETGERSEDDLTHKLVDIIRINQRLAENIDGGAPQLIIEDLWELLQYHVTTYFDNESPGIPPARHRSGRQLKTLSQRLKGKEGRFRYNLSGKRVNFSARCVVSPDTALDIDEIGVPINVAKELTVPIRVTPWNVEALKEFLRSSWQRVNYVVRPDGKRRKVTQAAVDALVAELAPGYLLERQLQDGDYVIFNRQPSLHRISMLAHRVRVLPGKTFRLNVATCTPYNADFDGDEMNIHAPQSEEALSELHELLNIGDQILSPRDGRAIIKPILDQLTGLYLLTKNNITLTRSQACWLAAFANFEPEFEGDTISGRQLFSAILPPLSLETTNREGERVVIKGGKHLEGAIDGKVIDVIIKEIYTKKGKSAAIAHLNACTRLASAFLTMFGLSLTLREYELPPPVLEDIKRWIRIGERAIRRIVSEYRRGRLEREPGKTLIETREARIMEIAEKVRRKAQRAALKALWHSIVTFNGKRIEHNSPLALMKSGARGSVVNLSHMAALVGQQAVRGKRVRTGLRGRVLALFKQGDVGARAGGFVSNSYYTGLDPIEYFFHACGGRDSMVDKGINPAKTGYMQRRLMHALQDFFIASDCSVRDAEQNIIQFKYGDDGRFATGEAVIPNDPIGTITAQSIGEPSTQMTLRMFHYAGLASLAQFGFTRLVEIVDARRTPTTPVMEVYLKPELARSEERAKAFAKSIEAVSLSDIAKIEEDFEKALVRIVFDREAIEKAELSSSELISVLEPLLVQLGVKKEGVADGVREGVLTFERVGESCRSIRRLTMRLRNLRIRGIAGVKRAILIQKESKGGTEWTLATEGSNLKAILALPEVDATRTTTNDFLEIERVLGIEAARAAIVAEIKKVLEAQEITVDERYIALIADAMTYKGVVKSVGRHGLAGEKASVLSRAAFEETLKHLFNAALYGECDELRGMAENIMIGQPIPYGTGRVQLVMQSS